MELLNHYSVSADILLDNYLTFDARTITMKELSDYKGFVSKAIANNEQEFLYSSVLDQAIKFSNKLKEIVGSSTKYMLELVRDNDFFQHKIFTSIPMSDAVLEECAKYPYQVAVGIMGEKVTDALLFIPNMIDWCEEFPHLKNVIEELVTIAYEAKDVIEEELDKMAEDAQDPENPMFFSWWHLDNVLGVLTESLKPFENDENHE